MRRQTASTASVLAEATKGVLPHGGISEEIAEKLRRLEVISELVEICNSTTNLNELMEKVFVTVLKEVGAEAGSLWLNDDGSHENVCHVAEGPTKSKVLNLRLEEGVGVVGYVIQSGECQTVYDTHEDKKFSQSVDKKTGFETRSMICAPLIVENKAIGALQLLNKKTKNGKFNHHDLSLLKLLCQGSATPIVNARLRASEKKVQELSIMLDISKEITSTLDLEGCMLSVVNLCSKLIAYDRAVIGLIDQGELKIAAISGQSKVDSTDKDTLYLKELLTGIQKKGEDFYTPMGKKYQKGENREPHIVEYLERYHQGSLAVYRLFDEESDLGVFMMESKKEHLISGDQTERIGILKNMLTVALRNAQLYHSVPKVSVWEAWNKAKQVPLKKYLIIFSLLVSLFGLLGVIKPLQKIAGKIEIKPSQKYLLYTSVEGQVKEVTSQKEEIKKGDVLIFFDTEDLEQTLEKQKSKRETLKQAIASLKLESKYSELHLKKIEEQQALLAIESTKRKLKDSEVKSPVDGYFINEEIYNLKDRRFKKGDELVEILAKGNSTLEWLVSEKEIFKIEPGQTLFFRVPAYPSKVFKGRVKQITYETVENEEEVYYPVLIKLEEAYPELKPGMTGWGKVKMEKESLLYGLFAKVRDYLSYKYWL